MDEQRFIDLLQKWGGMTRSEQAEFLRLFQVFARRLKHAIESKGGVGPAHEPTDFMLDALLELKDHLIKNANYLKKPLVDWLREFAIRRALDAFRRRINRTKLKRKKEVENDINKLSKIASEIKAYSQNARQKAGELSKLVERFESHEQGLRKEEPAVAGAIKQSIPVLRRVETQLKQGQASWEKIEEIAGILKYRVNNIDVSRTGPGPDPNLLPAGSSIDDLELIMDGIKECRGKLSMSEKQCLDLFVECHLNDKRQKDLANEHKIGLATANKRIKKGIDIFKNCLPYWLMSP